MTTSSDPDGAGQTDELPYLPPARLTAPAVSFDAASRPQLSESRVMPPEPPLPTLSAAPVTPIPTADSRAPSAAPTLPVLPTEPLVATPSPAPPSVAPTLAPTLAPVHPLAGSPTPSSGAPDQVGPDLPEPTKPHGDQPNRDAAARATVSDEGVVATRQLRAEAQRRRRRNTRLGWIAAVVLFAVAVVAGWSVYRAFENETGGGGARVSGPAPGAEAERVRTDGSGGLGRAVDGAREVLSGPESAGEPVSGRDGTIASGDDTLASGDGIAGPETVPPDQSGPPPRIANPPEYRTLLYAVRVDDGGEGSEAHHHVNITYDTVTDDYFGVIGDTENGETEVVAFADEWRYSIGSDGVHRRVRRSPSSLRPEPDTPFADLLTETAVLPLPARPFARLVSEEPTGEVGIDGTNTTVYSYVVDTEAFRTADPDASAQWRAMWAAGAHDDADLIVPGTAQVQLREVTGFELPDNHAPFTVPDVDVTPLAGQMGVVFRVTDRGVVDRVVLRSPDDGVRIEYVASEYHDEPATLVFSQDAWVEAP